MILYFGDPHGEFRHIVAQVRLLKPDAIILLGDIEAPLPLHLVLRPILKETDVWFIHGNHDTDRDIFWSNLYESDLAHKSLHARVAEVDGRRVAGLGGVFRQSVWMPGGESQDIQNYNQYCKQPLLARKSTEHADGMKLKARSSIFPDDYFSLAMENADILVTHEAPSCHPYGFAEIDELARSLGVTESVHGHHHDNRDYREKWPSMGFQAHGVAYRSWMEL
ncbi:metallophosphoesterase (plasmid) [Pseudomonas sp. FeN3W]|nr:metallophosphoesterase [Pseudomonas sp. FeN3W]